MAKVMEDNEDFEEFFDKSTRIAILQAKVDVMEHVLKYLKNSAEDPEIFKLVTDRAMADYYRDHN